MKNKNSNYHKGRGAQINTRNRFLATSSGQMHPEAIDDWELHDPGTIYLEDHARTIVNKVNSPDVGMSYSMNPYQGCEHGCIYCYARNTHEYWGYSAGLDFERKIIVKKNAPQLLRRFLMAPSWQCEPISISGNTDCYQPAEQQYRLTRSLLEICNEFNQPIVMITKNAGMIRDKDIITQMASKNLITIFVSVNSLSEDLRRVMEPRTTTAAMRLNLIRQMSDAGVRMGVILGPLIPGLNDHEIQRIMKEAAASGAVSSAYTIIRLNGAVGILFRDWLYRNFPLRADKVWHLIEQCHDGKVNDSRWGVRMRGSGNIADIIAQQVKKYASLYGLHHKGLQLDTSLFRRPGQQGCLF